MRAVLAWHMESSPFWATIIPRPVCEACLHEGVLLKATTVVGTPPNLQSLCWFHHERLHPRGARAS